MSSSFKRGTKIALSSTIALAAIVGLSGCQALGLGEPTETHTQSTNSTADGGSTTSPTEASKPSAPISPAQTNPFKPADDDQATADSAESEDQDSSVVVPLQALSDPGSLTLEDILAPGDVANWGVVEQEGPAVDANVSDMIEEIINPGAPVDTGSNTPGTGGGDGEFTPSNPTTPENPGTVDNPGTTSPENPGTGETPTPAPSIVRPAGLDPRDVTPEHLEEFVDAYNYLREQAGLPTIPAERFYISTTAQSVKTVNQAETFAAGDYVDPHADHPYDNEVHWHGSTPGEVNFGEAATDWWNSPAHRDILFTPANGADNDPNSCLIANIAVVDSVSGGGTTFRNFAANAAWVTCDVAAADGAKGTEVDLDLDDYQATGETEAPTGQAATLAATYAEPEAQEAAVAPVEEVTVEAQNTTEQADDVTAEPVAEEAPAVEVAPTEVAEAPVEAPAEETTQIEQVAPVTEDTAPADTEFTAEATATTIDPAAL